uniref:MIP18 family-like domain-containing protein n=1 Tax=Glossina palpalis gambiensis TaxID=67801 RepID=A0A1B0AY57_9MUSC
MRYKCGERDINVPEHPLTLEELRVVEVDLIKARNNCDKIDVNFTPTISHCSMAILIGLGHTR